MFKSKNRDTIFKAVDTLKCLTESIAQSSTIADHLKLNRSTTHKMLKTLQADGFVVQDPITLRYSLGPFVHFVHFLAEYFNRHHSELIHSALPAMEKLRNKDLFRHCKI